MALSKWCSDQTEICHNLFKPNFGNFLQTMNLIPTTGLTEMYLALDTLTARHTRNWNFTFSTYPGQVNLTVLTNATFLAVFGLSNFKPCTLVMTLHGSTCGLDTTPIPLIVKFFRKKSASKDTKLMLGNIRVQKRASRDTNVRQYSCSKKCFEGHKDTMFFLCCSVRPFSRHFRTGKQSKKISNDQELIQSDPISCPQNQKGNN